MARPKGGRLKCRYCEYRAPNPTEITHHVQASHPGYWQQAARQAKVKTISIDMPKDQKRIW